MDPRAQAYFEKFLGSLSPDHPQQDQQFDAYYFCADQENADICADLVLTGEKRATAGLLWSYQAENEAVPEVGQLSVITNWSGEPKCVTEVIEVEIKPFNEVTADFAFEEGEGNKSLEFWREVHWKFFSEECDQLGLVPSEDMPVVLEKFKVVYQE